MKKFMLIEVIGREIFTPEFCDSLEEAKKKMETHAKDCNEYKIEDLSAYGTTKNHDDWDAKIFEVIS